MHSLLDTYLKEVARHLTSLPAARRADELREVRTHLENAVVIGREKGQTEAEAAQAALAQFGAPAVIAQDTVTAWQRGEALNKRSFWGAVLCTVAVLFLLNFLVVWPLVKPYLTHPHVHPMSEAQLGTFKWVYLSAVLTAPILAGLATAVAFPRKAVSGAMLGLAVYLCYCWGRLAFLCATDTRASHLNTPFFVGQAVQNVEIVLATLLIAWAGSRLRMAGQRRRYRTATK